MPLLLVTTHHLDDLLWFERLPDHLTAPLFFNCQSNTRTGSVLERGRGSPRVDLDVDSIPALLAKARDLYELPKPPEGRESCKECANLENLIATVLGAKP